MSVITVTIPIHSTSQVINVESSSFTSGDEVQITGNTPIGGDVILLTLKATDINSRNIIFPKGIMYANMIYPNQLTIPCFGSKTYKFRLCYDGFSWDLKSVQVDSVNIRIDELEAKVGKTIEHGTSQTSGYTLTENDTHVWGEVSSLNLSSLSNPNGDYMIIFDTAAAGVNVTLPSNIIWNETPVFAANKTYYLGIIRGHGFFNEFNRASE